MILFIYLCSLSFFFFFFFFYERKGVTREHVTQQEISIRGLCSKLAYLACYLRP